MEHLEHKQKIMIMISIMAAMFFAAINMTIVSTSLPKILSSIGGMDYLDWVFTIYMLSATITAMLVGKLSDIYGRKIFILTGIGVFMTGAFLSGTADTIFQLISYRAIQGLGGGMIMSCAFATIGDLFSPRERGRWAGAMGAVFGLSSLFGPTLGGYIVDNYDWHWIFWIFLPIGFIAFALIWRLYPAHEQKEKEKVDYLGAIILAVIISSLLLGFSWAGNKYDWVSVEIIGLFSTTIIATILLIIVENRVQSPILPMFLFKNKIFVVSNVAGLLLGMGMFGTVMFVPFYVQGVQGETATISGLVEMVMTLSMVGASAIAGNMITKTGKYKIIALIGLIVMAGGLLANSFLQVDSGFTRIIPQLIVIGIGLGMTMPVFQLTVQNSVEHKYLGVATSAMQVFRQIGGTIGVALMGTVMSNIMKNQLEGKQSETVPAMPSGMGQSENLKGLQDPQLLMDPAAIDKMRTDLPEQFLPTFDSFVMVLREALNTSLTGVFFFCSMIILIAFVVTIFLQEIPLRTTNKA